jgi:cation:H+ antiporter
MALALLLLGGISLLLLGGHYLVSHAVTLATRLNVPPLVIGLTIVAFGTSAPELVISIDALLTGHDDIVIGNIIGSNIANLLLVLAVSAIIFPVTVVKATVRREGSILIAAALLFAILARDELISPVDGAILLTCLVGYTSLSFLLPPNGNSGPPTDSQETEFSTPTNSSLTKNLVFIAGALCALALGSRLFVDGAVRLSLLLGVSEAVIGLTVVAIGTAAPEIVTAAIAAWKRQTDIAVGNVVGSSIFNLLGITGTAALVSAIEVDPRFLGIDFGLMLAASITLVAGGLILGRVGRTAGAVMLAAYAAYVMQLG